MKIKSFDKGDYLYKNEETSNELYLIQSGQCWIQQEMDSQKGGIFVVEKLYRGSIINHNSFLMNDEMDTDALCKSNLHAYCIHIDQVNLLRQKYIEFDEALDLIERDLVDESKREPAIDYIIQDELSNQVTRLEKDADGESKLVCKYRCGVENRLNGKAVIKSGKNQNSFDDYSERNKRDKLTIKLKNAIMVVWGDVKKTRNKINIEDVIKDLQVKAKQQKDPDFLKIMKEQKKEEREFRRKEKLERILLYTDSYLNPDQFDYLRT